MNYLKECWAELKQIWPKVKVSNVAVGQAFWVFMFRIGPDWNKSIIPVANNSGRPVYNFVWEFRIGFCRVKRKVDIQYDKYLFDQPHCLEGAYIYKNFKFL